MGRRTFLKQLAVLAASAALPSWACKTSEPPTIQSGNRTFLIKDQILTQEKGSPINKIGIIADPHGHGDNMLWAVKQLEAEDVDAYLLLGDLSHMFGDSQGERDDIPELTNVIQPVTSTGKLVLGMPGNHENSNVYTRYTEDYKHDMSKNIISMETIPVADLEGITIIGFGGLSNPGFCNPKGFLRTRKDFEKLQALAKKYQKDKPLLLATHEPNKYQTMNGLDVLKFRKGENVGQQYFNMISGALKANRASGHIHESPNVITPDEQIVKPKEKIDVLHMNPGAVFDYAWGTRPSVGVIEVCGDNKLSGYLIQR